MLTVGTASGNKDVTELHVGTSGGNKAVTEGWVGTASGNKQFYAAGSTPPPTPSLMVSVSPTYIGWGVVVPGSYYVSNTDATVTVVSGVGPYSYAWEGSGGGSGSVNSPSAATTGFSSGDGYSAAFRCLVTDNTTGDAAYTDWVDVI